MAHIAPHAGWLLSGSVGGCLGARNSRRGQRRQGGCCQAAGEGVSEAGTETKACKAGGDRRVAAASPASRGTLGSAPFPTSACSAACTQQVCMPFRLGICPTLRTPLRGEQTGLARFCLCCLFLHPACILSDIIDGMASEGCFPPKQSWGRVGEAWCAQ